MPTSTRILPLLLVAAIAAQAFTRDTIKTTQLERGLLYFAGSKTVNYANANWNNSQAYSGGSSSLDQAGGAGLPITTAEGKGSLTLRTSNPGGGYWDAILLLNGGQAVNWMAPAGANGKLVLHMRWGAGSHPFKVKIGQWFMLPVGEAELDLANYTTPSSAWRWVEIPLADFKTANPSFDLYRVQTLHFLSGVTYTGQETVYIDEIAIRQSATQKYSEMVKVDQLGYLPDRPKKFTFGFEAGGLGSVDPNSLQFQVLDTTTGAVVLGPLALTRAHAKGANWDKSGDSVWVGDFSALTTPGTYVVQVPQAGQYSPPFRIGADIYAKPLRDLLRYFYYSRSGYDIVEPYAEGVTRNDTYKGDTIAPYDYKTGTRDVRGGWYDAGDLHKDLHPQMHAMFFLLRLLRDYGAKVPSGSLNIPGAMAGVSDLVPLIKYNLDWMRKMTNPDGSVQFWVSASTPNVGDLTGTVTGISNGAAITVAGTFALAYPLFKAIPGLASYADDTLLPMARQSWAWDKANPGCLNPPKPGGNVYGYEWDANTCNQGRFRAAVYLYNATGEAEFNNYIKAHFSNPLTDYNNQDWGGIAGNISGFTQNDGYMDYIASPRADADANIKATLKAMFKTQADFIVSNMENPYSPCIIADNHIYWGSNGNITGNAFVMNEVANQTANDSYRNSALECLHWVGGRNPVGYSMISGNGAKPVGIYSFFWIHGANIPPGYMVGGIDEGVIPDLVQFPWKNYQETHAAPMMEPTLHWNAETALAMAAFSTILGDQPTPVRNKTTTVPKQDLSLSIEQTSQELVISWSAPSLVQPHLQVMDAKSRDINVGLALSPDQQVAHIPKSALGAPGIRLVRLTAGSKSKTVQVFLTGDSF